MKTETQLSKSLEDYLEAILELEHSRRVARVRDIAAALGVGMPSVSVALRALAGKGLVNYDPYQLITLTPAGRRRAAGVAHRHQVIRDFLVDVLDVNPADAAANACRMEHAIDSAVLERLRRFAEFIRLCPRIESSWADAFAHDDWEKRIGSNCRKCIRQSPHEATPAVCEAREHV